MFGRKYNQVDIRRRKTIILALIAVMVFIIDVQLYCEQRVLANIAACTNKFDQRGDYFNMSLSDLMKVEVVSRSVG